MSIGEEEGIADMNRINESKLYSTLNESMKSSIDLCVKFVESLWEADPIILNYTDHSIKHSLRIMERLENLLSQYLDFFTHEEKYLLILAVILHDIGMQCDLRKHSEVKQVAIEKFGAVLNEKYAPKSKVFSEAEQNEIRENHHFLVAARLHCLALDESKSEAAVAIRSIDNSMIGDLIDICKFHSKLRIYDCGEYFTNSIGKKRLIAALVRLGDELDISRDRVKISILSEFAIPIENGVYWYLHNNTVVNILDNVISVYYRIRPDEADKFMELLQQDMIRFRNKNQHLLEVLWNYKLSFCFSSQGVKTDDYAPSLNNEFVLAVISNSKEAKNNMPIVQETIKTINVNSKVVDTATIFEFLKHEQTVLFEAVKEVYLDREYTLNNAQLTMFDILNCEKNYILLGEAGFGKTFFSKKLCFEALCTLSTNHRHFPIFIDLSNYGNTFNNLAQALHRIISQKIEITPDNCEKMITKGGFYFVLDGLDEVTIKNYKHCISELKEHAKNTKNRFFITCRTNRYSEELGDVCKKIELSPLNKSQIDKFLDSHNIHKYYNDIDYDTLCNPLLLSMIPSLTDERGLLPINKAMMYRKFCIKLFESWDAQKGIKINYSVSDLVMFLGKTAHMHFNAPFIEKSLFDVELSNYFGVENHKDILDCILKTGLLEYGDTYLRYKHKTFKEYFTANYILHNYLTPFNKDELTSIIRSIDYHEVILFIAGLISDYVSQKKYFDLILECSLKLYAECMLICPNIKIEVNSGFEKEYLNDIIVYYEKILNMHFPEIKNLFYPFWNGYFGCTLSLGITGCYEGDTSCVSFSLHLINHGDQKITIAKPNEIFRKDYVNFAGQNNLRGVIKCRSTNLKLSGYTENSASKVALDILIDELKELLKYRKLYLCKYLLASFIDDFQNKIRECRDKSFDELSTWVDDKVSNAMIRTGSKDVQITYDRVDLRSLQALIQTFKNAGYIYENCLLPSPDVLSPEHGWVWNFYSESRAIEFLQAFFWQYQKSFIEMCDMNFSRVKNEFPDYINYPYQYIVGLTFPNEDKKNRSSDYRVSYYYKSAKEESEPIVRKNHLEDSFELSDEIFRDIELSYVNRPFSRKFSLSKTLFSAFLSGRNDSTALIEMVFKKLENNLENIFGKLWR